MSISHFSAEKCVAVGSGARVSFAILFWFAGYVCFGFCVNGFAYRHFWLCLFCCCFRFSPVLGLVFVVFSFAVFRLVFGWLLLFFVVRLVWLEWFVVFVVRRLLLFSGFCCLVR